MNLVDAHKNKYLEILSKGMHDGKGSVRPAKVLPIHPCAGNEEFPSSICSYLYFR